MALIDHIDGVNRDIYLSSNTVGIDLDPMDIYKEMRTLRAADETLRKFKIFLIAKGRDFKGVDSKGNNKYTEKYVVEIEGTRLLPYGGTSHEITVIGTIITDDGQEGIACFDRSKMSPTIRVDINYVPKQVEIIEKVVTVGGSALTPELAVKLAEVKTAIDETKVQATITRKHLANKATISNGGLLVTISEDNKTDTFAQFEISQDKNTRTPI